MTKTRSKTTTKTKKSPTNVLKTLKTTIDSKPQQRQKRAAAQKIMEPILSSGNFKIKKIPPNGACLFASLASYSETKTPGDLRKEAVQMVSDNWDLFAHAHEEGFTSKEDYIAKMSKRGTYGDEPELLVLAQRYNLCVVIVNSDNDGLSMVNPSGKKMVSLYLSGRDEIPHYDVLLLP